MNVSPCHQTYINSIPTPYSKCFSVIDQQIIMDLFPNKFMPIKLPQTNRAQLKELSLNNKYPQMEIVSRVFEKEYKEFEMTHCFWMHENTLQYGNMIINKSNRDYAPVKQEQLFSHNVDHDQFLMIKNECNHYTTRQNTSQNKTKQRDDNSSKFSQEVSDEIYSDESFNYELDKLQLTKKKSNKIRRKRRSTIKRSRYYERLAQNQTNEDINDQDNKIYIKSTDIQIQDDFYEVFTKDNQTISQDHWLQQLFENKSMNERKHVAYNYLCENAISKENKKYAKSDDRVFDILNVCSLIIQFSQVHKEIQEYLQNTSKTIECSFLYEQNQDQINIQENNIISKVPIQDLKKELKNQQIIPTSLQNNIQQKNIGSQCQIEKKQIGLLNVFLKNNNNNTSQNNPQIIKSLKQQKSISNEFNQNPLDSSIEDNCIIENKNDQINYQNKKDNFQISQDTKQNNYFQIIGQFFHLKAKNKYFEDEYDFNIIKQSKQQNISNSNNKENNQDLIALQNTEEQQEQKGKKYGKFHNFNKLYMYNIIKMFQDCNLDNLSIPQIISQEVQNITHKIKVQARRKNNMNKDVSYDYFSIAHYNLLFFRMNQVNMEKIKFSEEYAHNYKHCFQIDIQSNKSQNLSFAYANIIKRFCYMIYIISINKAYINAQQAVNKTHRQEYLLKVTEGIQNLQSGMLVRRF